LSTRWTRAPAKAYGAQSFEEALSGLALQTRLIIDAHQCAVSYIPDGDFKRAIHTRSFSEKYERYNSYDVMPTGEGIWGVTVEEKVSMRMTEEELHSHPRWKNFSDLKDDRGLEHPVMRGWLVVPVFRQSEEFVGVLQLSDKKEGDFTEADLYVLTHLASVISPTFELQFVNQDLQNQTRELEEKK
jgi:GAF domain-containing protein